MIRVELQPNDEPTRYIAETKADNAIKLTNVSSIIKTKEAKLNLSYIVKNLRRVAFSVMLYCALQER